MTSSKVVAPGQIYTEPNPVEGISKDFESAHMLLPVASVERLQKVLTGVVELIKQKSYAVLHEMPDKQVLDNKFFDYIIDVFKLNYKINEFINKVIDHL